MECQPVRTERRFYAMTRNQLCTREETLETIVPDARGDIARILDTTAVCRLDRREITENGVLLAGAIQTVTLYVPEGGEGLERLESEIPFQHLHECPSQVPDTRLLAAVWVSGAETRVVNPRKVLLRVNLTEQLRLYTPQTTQICTSVEAEESLALQQRWNHVQTTQIISTGEKVFSLNDVFSLSPGRWEQVQVLRVLPQAECSEARLVGSRLVLKGTLIAWVLLCSGEGEFHAQRCELPFSQMLEAPEMAGEGHFQADLQVLHMTCGALSGDQRTLPVTAELLAQAVFWESAGVQVLSDLYSTRFPVKAEFAPIPLCRQDTQTERLPLREQLQTPEAVQTICCSHTELGTVLTRREGTELEITVPGQTAILYQGESGAVSCVVQPFHVQTRVELALGDTCQIDAAPPQVEALLSAAGMELRGSVEVTLRVDHESSLMGVKSAAVMTDEPWKLGEMPSVVLIRPGPGESVWEIAKRCRSTCQDILTANGLKDEESLGGQMLLVPHCR